MATLTIARFLLTSAVLIALSSIAAAQRCPETTGADTSAVYPKPPLNYPVPESMGEYTVQYRLDNGPWTDARVYISVYGGTNSSPYEPFAKYQPFSNYPSLPTTSMSFVSIPAYANAMVDLRITKLGNGPFVGSDQVSVRPAAKGIPATLVNGRVQISTRTDEDFAGEQFLLWWNRDAQHSGAVQGLAFFLDPPYAAPAGRVATLTGTIDAHTLDLTTYDAVNLEGAVVITDSGAKADPDGAGGQVLPIPANISAVFLSPGAWVQGKLRFDQDGTGQSRKIYGPGVLDVSRFNYYYRQCRDTTDPNYVLYRPDGFEALSWAAPPTASPMLPDRFTIDGVVITDIDYTATAGVLNGNINNVKVIGWNPNNDGLEMQDGTQASNVFVRAGDDSLELWGGSITVTNATVWQNAFGGVVNLGWLNKFPGDYDVVDGLYVVRTDWQTPATDPGWSYSGLNSQNNGIIVSLMVPGTVFGKVQPPVYRNIFIDDIPRVFLSLRILPPDCELGGLKNGVCPLINEKQPSLVNINIENVFTPQSTLQNAIGFETLPAGFMYEYPSGIFNTIPASGFTLTGTMNINLTNVFVKLPIGIWLPLLNFDSVAVGKISTNGTNVNIVYDLGLP